MDEALRGSGADDDIRLTRRELDAMSILWRTGSATVSELRDLLNQNLAYTTVLSILQTLEHKGFARHLKEGRAYRYYPELTQQQAARGEFNRLFDALSPEAVVALIMKVLREGGFTHSELREMRDILDRAAAPPALAWSS